MTSVRTTNVNRKKRTAGMMAVVMAVLLLLTGTFAWFRTIDALNEFRGKQVKSVVLHDDYDEKLISAESGWNTAKDELTFDKDVYVENTGQSDVYVRIRLDQYMEVGGDSVKTGADKDDMTTWTAYDFDGTDDIQASWTLNLGDQDKQIDYSKATDAQLNGTADRYAGGTDNFSAGGNVAQTLVSNTITMAAYGQLTDPEDYTGWILDTDGYAYWSQKLSPAQATGLLLDSVMLTDPEILSMYDSSYPGTKYYDFYYGIHVVLEAVDETDLGVWTNGDAVKNPVSVSDENYVNDEMKAPTAEAVAFLTDLSTR